jgi:UPF0755 protein
MEATILDVEEQTPREHSNQHLPARVVPPLVVVVLAVGCLAGITFYFNQPPREFPVETPIVIASGQAVSTIGDTLLQTNVVRSASFFKLMCVLTGASSKLQAGTYRFATPVTTISLVRALTQGDYEPEQVVITIPEGSRITDIDRIAATVLLQSAPGDVVKAAAGMEGYLFPETYHVAPDTTAAELVALMTSMYDARVLLIASSSMRSSSDIVTMASILEREGKTKESMHLISGILWKRLELGMPLQVDATLEYERGLGSAELSVDDLRTDSPYNTYTRKGLPPTPISNPGMVALDAALHPENSPYLFYLTGNDGEFYYAKDFEGHKRNKERYLR